MAILLLYIHLFAFKWARKAGQVLFGVVIISHIYMTIVAFTACIPLESYWDFTITKKYCHPQSMWWSSTGLHMGALMPPLFALGGNMPVPERYNDEGC